MEVCICCSTLTLPQSFRSALSLSHPPPPNTHKYRSLAKNVLFVLNILILKIYHLYIVFFNNSKKQKNTEILMVVCKMQKETNLGVFLKQTYNDFSLSKGRFCFWKTAKKGPEFLMVFYKNVNRFLM